MSNHQKTLVPNNDISFLFLTENTFSLKVNLDLGWDDNTGTLTNSLGNNLTIPLADSTRAAGLFSLSNFNKLNTISENAEPNRTLAELNALDLDAKTVNGFSIESSVPPNASFSNTTYQIGDGGLTEINFTVQRRDKLIGIENGAEKNRSLVELNSLDLDAKTVNGFSVESSIPHNAVFSDTTYSNLSEFQNDVGYLTNSALTDFETSIELNNRDQANRDRSNHTGTQPISSITEIDLTTLTAGEILQYNGTDIINTTLGLIDISDSGMLARLNEITDNEVAVGANIALSKLEINPLDRANHTGTQPISSITEIDLNTLITGQVLQYDGVNIINSTLGLTDISDSGMLAGLNEITDNEVAVGANIALSKLEINPLDRANHTGTQLLSTISDAGVLAGLDEITNSGVAVGAGIALSKLATDPLARANHTGSQPISSISEISLTTLTSGDVLQYDGVNITNASLGLADISDSGALAGLNEITNSEVATEAAIALSKLATDPLARANHTGTQLLSTISDAGNSASRNITGIDNLVCSGTAGVAGNLSEWNVDGDVIDSGVASSLVASALQNLVEDTTPQLGGTLDAQQEVIRDFTNNIIEKTGASETALLEDTGNIIEFNNGSAITLNLPNTLPKGWQVTVTQTGSGDVTFSHATGATLQNRLAHTKTSGQWAMVSLYVRSNTDGSSAEYVLSGDTA